MNAWKPKWWHVELSAIAASFLAPSLLLASPLEVVSAGERPFDGNLLTLSGDELEFTASTGAHRRIASDSFVRWSHPRDPARRSRVFIRDGSEIVADLSWTTDGAVQMKGNSLQIRTNLLGRIELPRSIIRSVLFDAARDPAVAHRVLKEMRAAEPLKEDLIWLVSGDRLSGDITNIDGAIAILNVAGDYIRVPLSNLSAVAFRAAEQPKAAAKWAIGLQDGTLLLATEANSDGQLFQTKLAAGIDVKGKSLDDVVFIQNLAGDFAYVSDLEPIDYKNTPYFDITWPLEANQNVQETPLRAGKERYLKGIAVHSASRAVYRLTGDETKFESTIAVDDTAGHEGSVVFRVYVVREGKPEVAFESNIIRGGEAPLPISVDIAGAQGLILLVDYADYGDQLDYANWLDARLVR